MKSLLRWSVLTGLWAILAASAVWAVPPCLENMFVINEDSNHFFGTRTPGQMSVSGLNDLVDLYARTKVTHIFFCPGSCRANFTNSARDVIWDPNYLGEVPTALYAQNCKLLEEKGIEPYKVWIDRCREKKISPWISMRMNDVHNAHDRAYYGHDRFWVNHPEYWRVPNDDATTSWMNCAFNYKHEAVRQYMKNFIDVLFDRYDFDGFELDWQRFGWHLTPNHAREESGYLTEIVRYARTKADDYAARRGHPIYVAARIPAFPEAALGLGMDGVLWAKEGLIDLLIVSPFYQSSNFNIPVAEWKKLLEGTNTAVIPSIESGLRAYPEPEGPRRAVKIPELYGFAAAALAQGANGIYLFNWMDCETRPVDFDDYRRVIENGFDADYLAAVERRIPLTYCDSVPPDVDNGAQLPKQTDKRADFTILVGPKPNQTQGNGVAIGLEAGEETQNAEFSATLNGKETVKISDWPTDRLAKNADRGIFFEFPQDAFQEGHNEFTVTQMSGKTQKIVFVCAEIAGE